MNWLLVGEFSLVDGYRVRERDGIYEINFKRNRKMVRTEVIYNSISDRIREIFRNSKVNDRRMGINFSANVLCGIWSMKTKIVL